jgi:Protein of unknown function (DUF1064)
VSWSKFHVAPKADRTDVDGNVFASKAEMYRWHELLRLVEARQVFNLRRQVRYDLHAGDNRAKVTSYTADFVYEDAAGNRTVEDVKGVETSEFKLKRKMMLAEYGISISLVRMRGRR